MRLSLAGARQACYGLGVNVVEPTRSAELQPSLMYAWKVRVYPLELLPVVKPVAQRWLLDGVLVCLPTSKLRFTNRSRLPTDTGAANSAAVASSVEQPLSLYAE